MGDGSVVMMVFAKHHAFLAFLVLAIASIVLFLLSEQKYHGHQDDYQEVIKTTITELGLGFIKMPIPKGEKMLPFLGAIKALPRML